MAAPIIRRSAFGIGCFGGAGSPRLNFNCLRLCALSIHPTPLYR
jgi:hypothetical protein